MKESVAKEYGEQIRRDFELRQEISALKMCKYHVADCDRCIHRAVCNMLGGYEELKKKFNSITFSGIEVESLNDAQIAMLNGRCIYFGGV